MLSKCLLISSLTTSTITANDYSFTRNTLQTLKGNHPQVKAGNCADAGAAVNRLKKGPANIPEVIYYGGQYVDGDFTTPNALFWDGYESLDSENTIKNGLSAGTMTWDSWHSRLPSNTLFKDVNATYIEPNQGEAGTCYLASAITTAAEWPSMITDMFIQGTEDPSVAIYGIRFYIRGMPWVVTIDDKLLFENGQLKHMRQADNGAMWPAMIEKAWAKAKGTYGQADGGFVVNGLRAITGAPVFTYVLGSSSYSLSETEAFDLLSAADTSGYPMGASTASGSNQTPNDCGIPYGHAFSILTTFTMSGTKMIMLRDPFGSTGYNGLWHKGDTAWTDALVAQVPFGIDPRTSDSDGIFVMPIATFTATAAGSQCIYSYQIGHVRNSDNYTSTIYDKEGDDGTMKDYFVTVPASDGDLYFMAETYYQDMVPEECTTGTYQGNSVNAPILDITIYKNGATVSSIYKIYSDQFNYPILVSTYSAGDVFRMAIQYTWYGSAAPDYTVSVYSKQNLQVKDSSGGTSLKHYDGQEPSGFTESSYRGMNAWVPPPPPEPPLYGSLSDVWDAAWEDGFFWVWWDWHWLCTFGGAASICWNPFAWFG